jgi:hypothetical protein
VVSGSAAAGVLDEVDRSKLEAVTGVLSAGAEHAWAAEAILEGPRSRRVGPAGTGVLVAVRAGDVGQALREARELLALDRAARGGD